MVCEARSCNRIPLLLALIAMLKSFQIKWSKADFFPRNPSPPPQFESTVLSDFFSRSSLSLLSPWNANCHTSQIQWRAYLSFGQHSLSVIMIAVKSQWTLNSDHSERQSWAANMKGSDCKIVIDAPALLSDTISMYIRFSSSINLFLTNKCFYYKMMVSTRVFQ